MSAAALIADLRGRGVKLGIRGDTLLIDAPKGMVGPDELATMRQHKTEIINLLSRQQGGAQSGPKGDTSAAWRVWYQACIHRHKRLGRGDTLAGALAWGESENIWHRRHGAIARHCRGIQHQSRGPGGSVAAERRYLYPWQQCGRVFGLRAAGRLQRG